MTFEEAVRAGRERVERQKVRELIIKTCVKVMVETRQRRVHAAAGDLLLRVAARSPARDVGRSRIE